MSKEVEYIVIFGGKAILTVDDEYLEVNIFHENEKLKKGLGYVKDGYVYVYQGKVDKFNKKELNAGIYMDRYGKYVVIDHEESVKDKYHVDNVTDFDVKRIFDEIEKKEEQFIDHEDIEIINSNSEFYKPTMNEDDDFLKAIVKKIIVAKRINLSNYKSKFTNPYTLNNLKSSLNKKTKMSVLNFKIWCEILGVNWTMIIEDNGEDKITPLVEPLDISSNEFL